MGLGFDFAARVGRAISRAVLGDDFGIGMEEIASAIFIGGKTARDLLVSVPAEFEAGSDGKFHEADNNGLGEDGSFQAGCGKAHNQADQWVKSGNDR
jgi:hypothetical protein